MDDQLPFVILLVIGSIPVCQGLTCYVCDTCPEPFIPEQGRTQSGCNACKKVKENNDVERSCSVLSVQSRCESISGFAVTKETCYCIVDLCNSATTVTVSSSLVTVMVILASSVVLNRWFLSLFRIETDTGQL